MITPSQFVDNIKKQLDNIKKQLVDNSDETEVIRALTQFYCAFLCQDPQDGTEFDQMVLDTLEMLHPKAEHRNNTSRRTNIDRRITFIKHKMLHKTAIIRPLLEGDPSESELYCPLPEYGVALWIDKAT